MCAGKWTVCASPGDAVGDSVNKARVGPEGTVSIRFREEGKR